MTEGTVQELDEIARANGEAFAAALGEMIDSGFGELEPAMPSSEREPRKAIVWEGLAARPESSAISL